MAPSPGNDPAESALAAPPVPFSTTPVARRHLLDRLGRSFVSLGGIAVVGSILAIFFVLLFEVYPLLRDPVVELLSTRSVPLGGRPLAIGVDEYRQVAFVVHGDGLSITRLRDGEGTREAPLPGLDGAGIVSVSRGVSGPFALGLSDGRILPLEVGFRVSYDEAAGDEAVTGAAAMRERRNVEPVVETRDPIVVDPAGRPVLHVAYKEPPDGAVAAAVVGGRELVMVDVHEKRALVGPAEREIESKRLSLRLEGEITAVAVDERGSDAFVGTSAGELLRIDLRDGAKATPADRRTVETGAPVTTLGFLIGDRTLVSGDGAGGIESWQVLRTDGGGRDLRRIHGFESHDAAVGTFSASQRHKGFFTGAEDGTIRFHYGTTGETLLAFGTEGHSVSALELAPKGDGLLVLEDSGTLAHWRVDAPHPETSLRSLFGKVWYEGYAEPEHVWQSTGGTDDFEPKLSLTPLVFGTLKGTFYALLFAIPIALLGALYTSQFMHPSVRAWVKPVVEIMAALPSVVLGFLAGLWLAPVVADIVPGIALMPIVVSVVAIAGAFAWRALPRDVRTWFRPGTEILLLLPLVLGGGWLSIQLGHGLEATLLDGNYKSWLAETLGLTYDQRNSLVVGIAMGFAVIPIIFTIAEDSLTSVPRHLAAGSLALGATPWQTAVRAILPTASPGIFSAVMIGFGRAVGETMIVLMATGNTPVMDWSIFVGFRALSANIAVELPEAPEGGTLYRVLFLAALLLFVITFLVNTAAELVRLRLRRKYRAL